MISIILIIHLLNYLWFLIVKVSMRRDVDNNFLLYRSFFANFISLHPVKFVIDFNKYIIAKHSFLGSLLGRIQGPFSILLSFFPFSFIVTAVSPKHLSVSFSYISLIVSFVDISVSPSIDPVTLFFIFDVGTLVFICLACTLFPDSTAVAKTVSEIAFVEAAVDPVVLSITVWFSEVKRA